MSLDCSAIGPRVGGTVKMRPRISAIGSLEADVSVRLSVRPSVLRPDLSPRSYNHHNHHNQHVSDGKMDTSSLKSLLTSKKQGRIHDRISHIRVGRGFDAV